MTTLDDAAERKISACLALVGTTGMETTHRDTLRKLWLAATESATEAAAKKCDEIASREWQRYKRGDHTDPSSGRADPHVQGVSCGADDCAAAIRGKL